MHWIFSANVSASPVYKYEWAVLPVSWFLILQFPQNPLCQIMDQLQQQIVGSAVSFLHHSLREEINSGFLLSVPFLLPPCLEWKEWLPHSIWKIIRLVLRRQCFWPLALRPCGSQRGSSSRKRDTSVKIYPDGVLLMSYRKVYLNVLNVLNQRLPLFIEITD